ncbi:MAG: hypothetical protein LBH79_07580 [Nitrososphaerota archaeon]|jgi:hypothetical protein|nr:hypothetical protein [Nitrososphaerota archaeon]
MSDTNEDCLETYDMTIADLQDLDQALGGNRKKAFIAKFGTREEFIKKMGLAPKTNPTPETHLSSDTEAELVVTTP